MQIIEPYISKYKIRIVTAASLFDGHDASINIMRRILQSSGAEVIHLGHDRSVQEIVDCAIQEDVQAIAITSYQGGHMEFFKYMFDLLKTRGAGHIKIFGGGGGTILPDEIKELHAYGIARIYHPDDGRTMGLQGMINDLLKQADFEVEQYADIQKIKPSIQDFSTAARWITWVENKSVELPSHWDELQKAVEKQSAPVIGITGTGGAGKSSLVDELVRRFLTFFPDKYIGIISVDPSKRKTGGALLGDRIRMNSIFNDKVYMRSLATRQSNLALSKYVGDALKVLKIAGFDLIILETSGIGQSDTEITDFSDLSLYVMTPEYGAATQLEKIDMLDFADLIALNKFDKKGGADALRDVQKQYQRNQKRFEQEIEQMPVYGTIASQFNDPGTNRLFVALCQALHDKKISSKFLVDQKFKGESEKIYIIPPARIRYLSEISDQIRLYNTQAKQQRMLANQWYALHTSRQILQGDQAIAQALEKQEGQIKDQIQAEQKEWITKWPELQAKYQAPEYVFTVRGKEIHTPNYTTSLSKLSIPKVSLPKMQAWGDLIFWAMQENVPGEFPFTAGVFPYKREGEDPTRMFAGEGGPERTNRRFHYVSNGLPAKRLSTAFDSVTLYGRDPEIRPDIYGKIGNAGVSICCLDDAKKLYSGFDLCDPKTSVSMTINGPAAMLTGFFMNAAIDQQCEKYIKAHGLEEEVQQKIENILGKNKPTYTGSLPEGNDGLGLMLLGVTGDQVLDKNIYEHIKKETLTKVRGTVQADILKEDQAQNTCIFSTEFALRLMGDMQAYFSQHQIQNFYSVSISGYHIAEAGANPITQLAFTLANGFTYVEYYLSRGMHIDDFAPNLSFFFSNGIDPEYAVIGRVARKIWAKTIKHKYQGNERSQKLKYHIQTSGRSLHAQEIAFNDIRTTLQALYAIYDNCNSLHTNAYDEAITTPTEESVRRAMAIQLIINHELGLAKNQNPLQGSFIIEELTDLVEEAVMLEFDKITERGGVLGAMETMYQRGKIQEESLYYETLKHDGTLPIMGVNTFLSSEGSPTILPKEVIRATEEEKKQQIKNVQALNQRHESRSASLLQQVKQVSIEHQNIFECLMEATKYCSLGQISQALFEVGGQYRRNM